MNQLGKKELARKEKLIAQLKRVEALAKIFVAKMKEKEYPDIKYLSLTPSRRIARFFYEETEYAGWYVPPFYHNDDYLTSVLLSTGELLVYRSVSRGDTLNRKVDYRAVCAISELHDRTRKVADYYEDPIDHLRRQIHPGPIVSSDRRINKMFSLSMDIERLITAHM